MLSPSPVPSSSSSSSIQSQQQQQQWQQATRIKTTTKTVSGGSASGNATQPSSSSSSSSSPGQRPGLSPSSAPGLGLVPGPGQGIDENDMSTLGLAPWQLTLIYDTMNHPSLTTPTSRQKAATTQFKINPYLIYRYYTVAQWRNAYNGRRMEDAIMATVEWRLSMGLHMIQPNRFTHLLQNGLAYTNGLDANGRLIVYVKTRRTGIISHLLIITHPFSLSHPTLNLPINLPLNTPSCSFSTHTLFFSLSTLSLPPHPHHVSTPLTTHPSPPTSPHYPSLPLSTGGRSEPYESYLSLLMYTVERADRMCAQRRKGATTTKVKHSRNTPVTPSYCTL